jgi:ankyrin repeat protein
MCNQRSQPLALACSLHQPRLAYTKLTLNYSLMEPYSSEAHPDPVNLYGPSLPSFGPSLPQYRDVSLFKLDLNSLALPLKQTTALHVAAKAGDADLVLTLLDRGKDIEARDNNGSTALHIATAGVHIDVMRVLLERGADIASIDESRDGYLKNLLQQAVESGAAEAVQLLFEHGANAAFGPDSEARTNALGMAAFEDYIDIVRLLLDHGTLIVPDAAGMTALHRAAGEHFETACLLIAHGADIRAVDSDGRSVLYFASKHGHAPLVRFLLNHGLEAQEPGQSNSALQQAAAGGHTETVRLLLAHGADAKALDSNGDTMLHSAACGRSGEIVRLILGHGADVNASSRDSEGMTALHFAVRYGHAESVLLLLEYGADVNARLFDGNTVLHTASSIAFDPWQDIPYAVTETTIVRSLLEHGADVDARNNDGLTPLEIARMRKRRILVSCILHLLPEDDVDEYPDRDREMFKTLSAEGMCERDKLTSLLF